MAAAAALQGSPSASSSERIGRNDPAPQRALVLLVPAWSSSQSSPPTMLQEWAPKNPFPEAPPTPRCQPLRPHGGKRRSCRRWSVLKDARGTRAGSPKGFAPKPRQPRGGVIRTRNLPQRRNPPHASPAPEISPRGTRAAENETARHPHRRPASPRRRDA